MELEGILNKADDDRSPANACQFSLLSSLRESLKILRTKTTSGVEPHLRRITKYLVHDLFVSLTEVVEYSDGAGGWTDADELNGDVIKYALKTLSQVAVCARAGWSVAPFP